MSPNTSMHSSETSGSLNITICKKMDVEQFCLPLSDQERTWTRNENNLTFPGRGLSLLCALPLRVCNQRNEKTVNHHSITEQLSFSTWAPFGQNRFTSPFTSTKAEYLALTLKLRQCSLWIYMIEWQDFLNKFSLIASTHLYVLGISNNIRKFRAQKSKLCFISVHQIRTNCVYFKEPEYSQIKKNKELNRLVIYLERSKWVWCVHMPTLLGSINTVMPQ